MDDEREFRLENESHGDRVGILTPYGEVDIFTAPEFKQGLMDLIEAGWEQMVVDLGHVTFIDSTGLGVLVSGAKRAPRGRLTIVCDDEEVLRIFDIVGFERLFAVHRTRADAYVALAAATGDPTL